MDHFDEISVEELQDALGNVEENSVMWGKEAYKMTISSNSVQNSLTQTELAEWYGVQRRTIYSWLKRLDTDGELTTAIDTAIDRISVLEVRNYF